MEAGISRKESWNNPERSERLLTQGAAVLDQIAEQIGLEEDYSRYYSWTESNSFRRAYDTGTVHYRRCSRRTVEAVAGACGLLADLTSGCPALRISRGVKPPGTMPFFEGCCSAQQDSPDCRGERLGLHRLRSRCWRGRCNFSLPAGPESVRRRTSIEPGSAGPAGSSRSWGAKQRRTCWQLYPARRSIRSRSSSIPCEVRCRTSAVSLGSSPPCARAGALRMA